ncbi:MAG: XRE family transcriptional regulator [Acidobacteriota bacterium]
MDKKQNDRELGARVAELRKRRGLSQKDLAQAAGFKFAQVLCDLEAGKRALKATELVRLASFFGVPATAILTGELASAAQRVLWRGAEGSATPFREREEQVFLTRCRRYAFLERLAGHEPKGAMPSFEPPKDLRRLAFEEVGSWADKAREMLSLGARPALSLREALEGEWGIKIFFSPLQGGSALTARGDFGSGICLRGGEPAWRVHFSLAHELFHLLTWEGTPPSDAPAPTRSKNRTETLADVFASRLLLPVTALDPFINSLRTEKGARGMAILEAAHEFGVSVEAVVWRMVNLDVLSREEAQKLLLDGRLKVLDRGRRPCEACHEPAIPQRFVFLAVRCFLAGKISRGKLAELMETTVGDLGHDLDQHGYDLDSDAYEAKIVSA